MFNLKKNLLITFLVLMLATTACEEAIDNFTDFYAPDEWFGEDEAINDEDQVQTEPPIQIERQEAQPTPTVIVIEQQPEVQGCFWHNYEISPPAESTSNPAYEIDTSEPFSITTTFTHGISSCQDQFFKTFHNWSDVPPILWPGETESYWIGMDWENIGSSDCSALVAGASTGLSIDDFRLKASEETINVKTDPLGSREDSGTWTVPEGKEGDTFTLTIQAITGSYGGTTRYRFRYTCNLAILEDYEGFSPSPTLPPTSEPIEAPQPEETIEPETEEQPVEPEIDQPDPEDSIDDSSIQEPTPDQADLIPPDEDSMVEDADNDQNDWVLPVVIISTLATLGVLGVLGITSVGLIAKIFMDSSQAVDLVNLADTTSPESLPTITRTDMENSISEQLVELKKQGHYVGNRTAVSKFWNLTVGQVYDRALGYTNNYCEEFEAIGRKELQKILPEGTHITNIIIERNSLTNHIANRVILPDGSEYVIDYWQSMVDGKPAIYTVEEWEKTWNNTMGENIVFGNTLTRLDDKQRSLEEFIYKYGVERIDEWKGPQAVKNWRKNLDPKTAEQINTKALQYLTPDQRIEIYNMRQRFMGNQ